MRYAIEFKPAAERQLRSLPEDVRVRLQSAIDSLSENPFPPNRKKMAGKSDRWRIRVGDYRVIYEVHSHRLLILVIAVGHRREIYR